jgi:hypothetical protein
MPAMRWMRVLAVPLALLVVAVPAAAQPQIQPPAQQPRPQPPSVPPAGSNEAIDRFMQYVTGEWLVETPGQYAGLTVRLQVRYLPDATFRGARYLIGANPGGAPFTQTTPVTGRWSVTPIDDRRFVLTVTGASLSGSTTLEVLDQNRLRNEQENYIAVRVGR